MFLVECVAKISEVWNGLRIKLIPDRDIPRRPRVRIWLPKGHSDHEKLARMMNPYVKMDVWAVLKAEQEM